MKEQVVGPSHQMVGMTLANFGFTLAERGQCGQVGPLSSACATSWHRGLLFR
jgi:hypothetical protein